MFWKKYMVILFICVIVCFIGFFATYKVFKYSFNKSEIQVSEYDFNEISNLPAPEEVKQVISLEQKVTDSTKFIYQYFYEETGKYEQYTEKPPYFIIGMNRNQLQNAFEDWYVHSFSADEVVMRKNIAKKIEERYIVGIHNGYVAIFYEEETNGVSLYEVTDIVINALATEDQEKLKEGIYVSNYNELNRILEDYGS